MDPHLPDELLPADWPGRAAAAYFDEQAVRLLPAAGRFIDRLPRPRRTEHVMSNGIGYDVTGAVATVTLDRPDSLNSLTVAMKVELLEALDRARGDETVRAVLLTGVGRGVLRRSGPAGARRRPRVGSTPLSTPSPSTTTRS